MGPLSEEFDDQIAASLTKDDHYAEGRHPRVNIARGIRQSAEYRLSALSYDVSR